MMRKKYFHPSLRVVTLSISLVAALVSITACSQTKIEITKSNQSTNSIQAIKDSQANETEKAVEETEVIVENTLEAINGRDKIVIGVKTDYTPFGFIDSDGENAGLEIDIARRITEEVLDSEEKVEFVPVTALNRIDLLKQGKIDLVIATMTDTEERRQEIDFSENYYSSGVGVLTKKGNGIKTWEDLKGKTVCGIEGAFYNEELTEMKIEMVNFSQTSGAYKSLQEGLCVGFAYDELGLVGKIQDPEWSQNWHQPLEPILQKSWGMGVRKGNEQFLTTVNDAILDMEAEGFIVEGEKKWNIPPTEYAEERMEQAKAKVDNN
ncbi:MAG: transporter substrate-binding domain-containing protein [Symploca sp. SIO3E6]|nr:transporter substrate-binding domain-containing protein [Caldora sp. SIO3E6]